MKIKILDQQLKKRPKKIVFCKKCVVSNQRPRITFDEAGVCSACRYAEMKKISIDWKKRNEMLWKLLDKYRAKDGSYDCLVPASGGKDSGFVAHQLRYQYGMHPLTITWAPFIYTDIGWENYVAFKDAGFDNLLFFPNGQIHRKLARLSFLLHGDAWDPFAYGQKTYALHLAIKFNIKLIFYGESGEVEYGGSTKNMFKTHESPEDFKELYFKGSGVDNLIREGLKNKIFSQEEIKHNPLDFYRLPDIKKLQHLKPEIHWFSFYKKWIPQENYYYASEHMGFSANPVRSEGTYSKYASLDDKTDGFHFYLAYIKFGLGRCSQDAAHEIRDGHLTREEGTVLVKKFDGEFPKRYFSEFLEYLGITEKEFGEVIDYYRKISPHLWCKKNGEWKLRHTVWGGGVDD